MRNLIGAALLAVVAGSSAEAATPEDVAAKAAPKSCADVTTAFVGTPNVRIVSAKATAATGDEPAACVVIGAANERTGADGAHYALGFELRLPETWNGRFLHQVNGGNDGEIVAATGDPKNMNAYGGVSALARGFAVLSGDEGHSGADPAFAVFGIAGGSAFGFDAQARADYGYAGDATLAPIAKAIIADYYGVGPARSYMMGCSNGGRHAMVAASRTGEALRWLRRRRSRLRPAARRDPARLGCPEFLTVDPDIRNAFSLPKWRSSPQKVAEACSDDGMVYDIRACQKLQARRSAMRRRQETLVFRRRRSRR